MTALAFDVEFTEGRDRLSNGLRVFYALPHLLIAGVLGQLAQLVSVLQWFVILFRGTRDEGLYRLTYGALDWQMRAYTYAGLMYDHYPNFGFEGAGEPVTMALPYEADADRLRSALRLIWAIPAMVIGWALGIALLAVAVVTWCSILLLGRQSRGMFDFMVRVFRFQARLYAYLYLMTDTYPSYE